MLHLSARLKIQKSAVLLRSMMELTILTGFEGVEELLRGTLDRLLIIQSRRQLV